MLKIIIILIATLVLGGCTLLPKQENAAKDQALPSPTTTSSPTPSLSTETTESSLETDLNATVIEDEDFSDLQ